MGSWGELAKTNRLWRDGKRRVAEERARIDRLDTRGEDVARARELLEILEEAVLALEETRRRLMLEVGVESGSPPTRPGRHRRRSARRN
jgi:hypothetical protein